MSEQGWPAWGALAWVAVIDDPGGIVLSCTIIPGRVQSGTRALLNPVDKPLSRQIDRVTLYCKSDSISLTMLYEEAEKIIRGLERSLASNTAEDGTLAGDFFIRVKCQLAADERGDS
jgi:hypothetical protein